MKCKNKDGDIKLSKRPTFLMVAIGISLFVVGFIITLTSISGSHLASDGSDSYLASESTGSFGADMMLFVGIALSLSGVVFATAGPAVFFIHRRMKHRSM